MAFKIVSADSSSAMTVCLVAGDTISLQLRRRVIKQEVRRSLSQPRWLAYVFRDVFRISGSNFQKKSWTIAVENRKLK